MIRKKITTIAGLVVTFACVANAGFAQTQATHNQRTTGIRETGSVCRRTGPGGD